MDRRERLIARARQGYRLAFGVEPTRFVAAPGRVNLIGEHVDYNDGFVLPCAIDRETVIAFGPGAKDAKVPRCEAVALDMGDMASARDAFDLTGAITRGENNWQNHVRGVVKALGHYGHRIRPKLRQREDRPRIGIVPVDLPILMAHGESTPRIAVQQHRHRHGRDRPRDAHCFTIRLVQLRTPSVARNR